MADDEADVGDLRLTFGEHGGPIALARSTNGEEVMVVADFTCEAVLVEEKAGGDDGAIRLLMYGKLMMLRPDAVLQGRLVTFSRECCKDYAIVLFHQLSGVCDV